MTHHINIRPLLGEGEERLQKLEFSFVWDQRVELKLVPLR